jgi:endonuclease III
MARKTKPARSKLPPRTAATKKGPAAQPGSRPGTRPDATGATKSAVSKLGSRKPAAGTSVAKRKKPASQAVSQLAIPPKSKAAKLQPKPKPWTEAEIEEAFRRLRAANPEPRGELQYINPFTLLVAVVLSAQATDAGVNKATPALFAAADTPEKMVALGEDRVREMIRTIGLFRTKAKNVIALSEKLIAEHGGMVPPSRDELEKLPGVGRKTANVVLNIAFGEETIAVDTHIFRVGNRTGMARGKNEREVETELEKRVPPAYRRHAHHWLILHGRYICKAQRPLCGICPINDLCQWPEKPAFMGK